MHDLITGDNLIAFEVLEAPPGDEDSDDFHLAVYTLGDNSKDPWMLTARIEADQLAGALHRAGLLPDTG